MRIIEYNYSDRVGKILPECAVSLGFFDGVHLGHRELILDTVRRARELGIPSAVFTFSSEAALLKPAAQRLYSTEDKLRLIGELGVDAVIVADFDSLSGLSPSEFVRRVLVGALGARLAVVGEDFRFGYRASGNSKTLKELMRECGCDAVIHRMRTLMLDGESVEISSSLIREYLSRAELDRAAALLSRPYTLFATVEHGRGAGRSYGYPTVNCSIGESFPLPRGVYRTSLTVGGIRYTGLTNVGTCPTFGARKSHAETYILDFSGEVYDELVEIEFIEYIREEREFPTREALLLEIEKNIEYIRKRGADDRED